MDLNVDPTEFENEKWFRLGLEAAPNGILVVNQQQLVTLMNSQAAALFGYECAELLRRPVDLLFRERPEGCFGVRKNGSEFPIEVIVRSLPVADGALVSLAVRDITELKQGMDARAFLASIVESSEDSIIGTDLHGTILSWNQGAENLFSYSPQDAIGKHITILFPEERRKDHLTTLEQIRHQEHIERFESKRIKKDGTPIDVSVILSPIRNAQGRLQGVSAIYREITKQKKAEAELVMAKQAAESASLAKSEFLANMSHEIRTPMNVLLGMSGLLLETSLSEEQEDFARTIRRGAESLLTIINDILDFSKIEAGKLDIDATDFLLEEVVGEVMELVGEQTSRKGLDLNAEIDPEIPRAVHGDPVRVRQVLLNLVGNAVKFTERGEIHVSVRQEGVPGRIHLRFEVRDTGIGIDPAAQERIFDSFTQADGSTTRKYGGTGLGLSISKKLAELMGGSIGLSSQLGTGSTFWFTIPLVRGTRETSTNPQELACLSGLKVLAVDDSETNRRIVKEQLRSLGIDCTLAENAMQAIIQVREAAALGQAFDLVILDFGMPGMNGVDLARIIRSDTALTATRLMLMTSYAEKKCRNMSLEAGIDVVLNKPVLMSDLSRALARATGRSASRIAPTPPPRPTTAPVSGRLLLVEDHPDNRRLALYHLAKYGYQCDVATNGEEAVRALAEYRYSLVLMDCQMPVMDGFQATAAIRRMEVLRHTPIIALTAHAIEGDAKRCLDAGMDDYLSKPLTAEKLLAMVQRWALQPVRVQIPRGLEDMIPEYLSNRRTDVQTISEALERNDIAAIKVIGHGMKGSGAGYGFSRITEIGEDLELAARAANLAEIQSLKQALAEYVEHVEISYE
jgi:two-component system sensor histidine kinase/response regulator